jgi:acyl-CoA thioesterase FadM
MEGYHTQRFRIRFDECGHDGAARSSTILRYVVETAFAHSASVGYPLSWYFSNGLFWLVRQARLILDVPVAYSSVLEVTTQVVGARRIWARRFNTLRNSAGLTLGTATMDWILTNPEGRPARIPPEMKAAFPVLPIDVELERQEIGAPPATAHTGRYRVPTHQTDPQGHMNNAAYLDLFDDTLAAFELDPQERPAEYNLEYLRSVPRGVVLEYAAWIAHPTVSLVARLSDGSVAWQGRRIAAGAEP